MRLYRERLRVPVSWWLAGGVSAFILGTTLWAGFSVTVGLLIYLGSGLLLALAFLTWGALSIEVTDTALTAGQRRLALSEITEASAMDGAQTTALRGPAADVTAYLLVRPYLAESVYIAVRGQPYWLIGTRRPVELAAAIQAARSRAGLPAACDDETPKARVVPGA
jgi:hypothetical protein